MNSRAGLIKTVLFLTLGLTVALAAQTPERQRPSFRAGVEIVSLNVTVTDGTNRYVTDLDREDFQVFEDGVKQEVTFFNRRSQPIALSLLLDSSASMEDKLETMQTAAVSFVRKLKPVDVAGDRLRQPRRDQAGLHVETG